MDKNNIKLKFISGAVATTLALGGSFMVSDMPNAYADTIVKTKQGTFIEDCDEYEEGEYTKYVVQKGDNASNISKKICRYFGVESTTKYWPVIAYLNDYPRTINKGDQLIFPSSYKDMDDLLNQLDESGWTNNYKKLLKKRKEIKEKYKADNLYNTVGAILDEIYGAGTRNDQEFVNKYLNAVGFAGDYDADTILTKEEIFKLTEWIPTLEELNINVKKK